jgi:hypothetical protein
VPKQILWNASKAPEPARHVLPHVLPAEIWVWGPRLLSVVPEGLSHKGQDPALDRLLQGPNTDVVPGLVPSEASHYHLTDRLRPKLNQDFLLQLRGKMGSDGSAKLRMVTIGIRRGDEIRSSELLFPVLPESAQELQTHHQRPRDM